MISRRAFFQGLSATTAAGLLSPVARGTPPTTARRILFYVSSHGTVHDQWAMPGRASLDTAIDRSLADLAESDMSYILQPLWPYRRKLLVVDGLANYAGLTTAFIEHQEGQASCLSGFLPIPVDGAVNVSSGPSLDQLLGEVSNTPIRSLEYATGAGCVNYDAAGQSIPYEFDVWAAYQRLFPSGASPDGPSSVASRVAAHQARSLDLAQARFDALAKRLPAGDRAKLQQHRDLLGDLVAQIKGLAELGCESPPPPGEIPSRDDPMWPQVMMEAFFSLTQAAFACGVTDVVTVRGDMVANEAIGAPPGDLHTDYAHNVASDPAAADIMADYHRWHAERFAALCAMLEAVPEGSGTMLDQTLCVWTNELATGDHLMTRHPFVVAGGTDVLETGRYVNFPPERDFEGPWGTYPDTGPAHNGMLVVLARAMGLDVLTVGDASFTDYAGVTVGAKGPLPGLLKT